MDTTSQTAADQPVCLHTETLTKRARTGFHFAKVSCARCGRFLRWIPKPENVERQRLNAFRLAQLGMHEYLNDWERKFVTSVSKLKKLSPLQQAVVDDLVKAHLVEKL
jgi:hypothetical protein